MQWSWLSDVYTDIWKNYPRELLHRIYSFIFDCFIIKLDVVEHVFWYWYQSIDIIRCSITNMNCWRVTGLVLLANTYSYWPAHPDDSQGIREASVIEFYVCLSVCLSVCLFSSDFQFFFCSIIWGRHLVIVARVLSNLLMAWIWKHTSIRIVMSVFPNLQPAWI